MKAAATVLSNNILFRAKKERISVTPMKLQKLLYYVCVKYVQETGTTPIYEPFSVWQYGPVVPSVYAEFSSFGASPIKGFARDARKQANMVDEDYNPVLRRCLNFVWDKFKSLDGISLSKRTHEKGSGWYAAYQRYGETITVEEMRNDATI